MTEHLSFLTKFQDLKILVAPLCWGLGHATRCLPLINILEKKNEVIIASDGVSLKWLQREKPLLQSFELPPYNITYSNRFMWLNMVLQGGKLFKAIKTEQERADQLVLDLNLDLIISDHRLGVRSDLVQSILIAHQLCIPHKNSFFRNFATRLQKSYVNLFDEVWIPDSEGIDNLSGELSNLKVLPKKRYIGPLSRFVKTESEYSYYHLAVTLSGPEPSRSHLEKTFCEILPDLNHKKIVLIRGTNTPFSGGKVMPSNVKIVDLASTVELNDIFHASELIVCRSGYSSIMDLYQLGKPAILIPTPNQPEQEYLATLNCKREQFYILQQDQLTTLSLLQSVEHFQSASK